MTVNGGTALIEEVPRKGAFRERDFANRNDLPSSEMGMQAAPNYFKTEITNINVYIGGVEGGREVPYTLSNLLSAKREEKTDFGENESFWRELQLGLSHGEKVEVSDDDLFEAACDQLARLNQDLTRLCERLTERLRRIEALEEKT